MSTESEIIEARRRLARRIRQLRKKRKWTQQELAERADLNIRHIQRLESTKKTPAIEIDSIVKLSKALSFHPSQLLDY
jgi:transcriptional regulator with XRE-family HTH domain